MGDNAHVPELGRVGVSAGEGLSADHKGAAYAAAQGQVEHRFVGVGVPAFGKACRACIIKEQVRVDKTGADAFIKIPQQRDYCSVKNRFLVRFDNCREGYADTEKLIPVQALFVKKLFNFFL